MATSPDWRVLLDDLVTGLDAHGDLYRPEVNDPLAAAREALETWPVEAP